MYREIDNIQSLVNKLEKTISGLVIHGLVHLDKEGACRNYVIDNKACLAHLMSLGTYNPDVKPLYVVYKVGHYDSSNKLWAKWLSEESPFKHVFVMKEEYNVGSGYLVAACNVDANYMAVALNILRLGLENRTLLSNFVTMVEAGVTPNLAGTMMSLPVELVGEHIGVRIGYRTLYASHSSMSYSCSGNFVGLLSGEFYVNDLFNIGSFSDVLKYSGASTAIGGEVEDFIKEIKKLDKVGVDKAKAKVDLLGRPYDKDASKKCHIFTVETLNNFWSDYVKRVY